MKPLSTDNNSHSGSRAISAFFLILQILLVTWFGSGTRAYFFMPMFVCAFMMFAPILWSGAARVGAGRDFFTFPIFWFHLSLCLIAIAGCFNFSARFIQESAYYYVEKLDYIKWLPSAVDSPFTSGNPVERVAELLSVLFVLGASYTLFGDRKFAKFALVFFAVNGTAMAVFAIAQKYFQVPIMYGYFYSDADMYGTFFLSNACGAFLNLVLSANLALATESAGVKKFGLGAIFIALACVCSASVVYSGSNGAILSMAAVWAAFGALAVYLTASRFIGKMRAAIFIIALAAVLGVSILSTFSARVSNFLDDKATGSVAESASSRVEIYKSSLRILDDKFLWGHGGNSVQYAIMPKLIAEQKQKGSFVFTSFRHVHSDFLQYLFEFGAAGAGLIFLSGVAWIVLLYRRRSSLSSGNAMLAAGILLCVGHSFFDMHLSIPSVMIAMAILAMISISRIRSRKFGRRA